ncbi:MAG: MFS transporter [Nitriliruptor sp.]
MRTYLALLTHPDARWPVITSTCSRLTPGMIALALVLASRDAGYSYAVAGVVTGAHQIGVGLGSPFQGKLVDRFGQTVVLVPDAVGYAIGCGTLALLLGVRAPVWALLLAATLTGVVYPPTTACARVVLSRLFPTGPLRETAFAVSSIAVELGFIAGPLAATVVAARAGGRYAVLMAGLLALVGALAFSATKASRGTARRDVAATGRGGALRAPGVRVMVVALGFVAVVFGAIDVVLPAVAEFAGRPEAAGPLVAAIAAGSLVGGLVYGGRTWPGALHVRLRVVIVVLGVSLAVVPLALPGLGAFGAALFLGGLFLGPTTIVAFQLIDDLSLPGTQTEAQSWTQSAVVVGVAGGAALAGQLVEAGSPSAALFAGAGSVGIGTLVVFAAARHLVVADDRGALAHAGPGTVLRASSGTGEGPVVGTPATPEDAGVQVGLADEVIRGALAERVRPRSGPRRRGSAGARRRAPRR